MNPWEKLKETSYKAGYRKMLNREFRLPDGKVTSFDVVDGGRTVCILPITKDRHVLMAKQFRVGPEKVLLELPGGGIEQNETPIHAAERELLEETGYKGKLEFVGESLHSAYDTLVRYNFIATDCEKVRDIQNPEYEFTEAEKITFEQFKKHLQSGNLTDMGTGFLCMDYLLSKHKYVLQ